MMEPHTCIDEPEQTFQQFVYRVQLIAVRHAPLSLYQNHHRSSHPATVESNKTSTPITRQRAVPETAPKLQTKAIYLTQASMNELSKAKYKPWFGFAVPCHPCNGAKFQRPPAQVGAARHQQEQKHPSPPILWG